jgi:hypothetical protein
MQFTDIDVQGLAIRLNKLESQNRKWKIASVLLGLTAASLIAMAAKPADHYDQNVMRVRTVEAQDFILKDEDGQVHARLTLNPRNKVEMNGRSAVEMNGSPRPALQFYDAKGDTIWAAPQTPTMIPAR